MRFTNIIQRCGTTSKWLYIPRTKRNLGKHAISVAAPDIWNELPTTLKVLPLSVKISKRIFSKLPFHLNDGPSNGWRLRFLKMINDFVLLRFWAQVPWGFKHYRRSRISIIIIIITEVVSTFALHASTLVILHTNFRTWRIWLGLGL